jgi:hypothetical protein
MAKRYCKCGHRFYKHGHYPLDWPYCKGKKVPQYSPNHCPCRDYEPVGNLEYLESEYEKRKKSK